MSEQAAHFLPEHLLVRWQAGEQEPGRRHLQAVLQAVLTYLPRTISQDYLADRPPTAGRFVQATLLFADISGFTALSERLGQLGREGAEVITRIVNDYFATMLEIIHYHGGDLWKFAGDALLVAFGAGGEGGAALGAASAALEMQAAMARFAHVETDQGTFSLGMTVGLGTGTLLLSSLDSSGRREFAAMGSGIKQMAAAEELAKLGEVVADQATCTAVGDALLVEERAEGFHVVRGLTRPALPSTGGTSGGTVDPLSILPSLVPYLPPGILERIVANPGQVMIEGEHRLVTVLFANFYGIDEIIEALGPGGVNEIITILDDHFAAMQAIVARYEGMVNKIDTYAIGYRIMAVFGAPIAHEDDPARAVRAALEMQAAMAPFARLETSAGPFALKQRIGVNTGYVFAGNLGSTLRQEYSVMGDEVNLASRLMGVAGEGEVLLSASTARRVSGLFEWHEREPVKVKGKAQPVRNYHVRQAVAGREAQPAARGAFFGRERELALAQELVTAAAQGHGAGLDITGEPGIGKSRLAAETAAYAAAQGMRLLRSEAISYGQTIPYLPWTGLLQALLGFEPGGAEGPERRREKLLSGLSRAKLDDWAPIAGDVLGVPVEETPLTTSLDARLRQQRFFDIVLQLLLEESRRTPLMVLLDNMQWADSVSLELVTYVMRNVGAAALLFAVVHRSDLDPCSWYAEAGCHRLHLAEVGDQASRALAQSTLEGIALSPALYRLILIRAQGNPLFVEEIARSLRESGTIHKAIGEQGEAVWEVAAEEAAGEVPTTLAGLLMSRIDRLEATNRRLLQVAAVIGVAFSSPLLARVYPYGDLDGTLADRLGGLIQAGLLQFSPPDEYTFQHPLTQEAAYESLPFARRRELHVGVGLDIERHYTADIAEQYGALAHHFDQGRLFDKAFTYLTRAGNKARAEYANEAALSYYRRALEVVAEEKPGLPDLPAQVLDAREAMGSVYLLIGHYEESVQLFQQAIDDPLATPPRRSNLLCQIALAYERQGQYDEALQWLGRAGQVLTEAACDQPSLEMARIYEMTSVSYRRRGEYEQAAKVCEKGLLTLAGMESRPAVQSLEADLQNTMGTIHSDQGNYSAAAEAYRRSTELRQQIGELPHLSFSYNNLAFVAWVQGDLAGAGEYLQRSLEISQQIGDTHTLAQLHNNLGAVSYRTGQVEAALAQYQQALTLRQRIGDSYGVAQSCSNIGEAYLSQGRYDEAGVFLERSAATFEAIHCTGELPEVYCLLAEVEMARANLNAASDYAARARRLAEDTGNAEYQGIAGRILGRVHVRAGDAAAARQSFEQSVALLQGAENALELGRSHYHLGLFLLKQPGEFDLAREHLLKAAELLASAGAEEEAKQAREAGDW